MSTNCTVIAPTIALTCLLITTPTFHGMPADAGHAALELIEASDSAMRPLDGRGNAAATYLRAFDALDKSGITDEEWLIEGSSPADPARWDPDLARSLLGKSEDAIGIARTASQHSWVAFGSAGPHKRGAIMPQLTPMRRLSRLMGMQARMLRIEGHDDEANDLLGNICLIAHHAASDNVPIASLAASACALQAIDGIEEAIALGAVDRNTAASLRAALGSNTDPFRYADSVAAEREATLDWLHEDPANALEECRIALGTTMPETPDPVQDVATAFDEVESILRIDHPDEATSRMSAFESDLVAGSYGPLASHLLGNHARIIGIKIQVQQRVCDLDSKLHAIQLGMQPTRLANASVLYEYAFPYVLSLDEQDQEVLELVRRFVSIVGSTEGLPESTITHARDVLRRLEPVREIVARAAWCRNCTWNEAENAQRLGMAIGEGSWVGPMQGLARICLADAALAIDAGHDRDASRAIADALAVAIHMADGSHLLASAVAAAVAVEIEEMTAVAIDHGRLSGARMLLEERLARIDRHDPLAWRASREMTLQSRLLDVLVGGFTADESSLARRMRRWNDDRLASITYLLHNRGPSNGALLALDNVVATKNAATRDKRIRLAGDQIDQVLMIIDDTRPIRAGEWRRSAIIALDSIQKRLAHRTLTLARSAADE